MGYRKRVTGAGLREGVTGRVLREQGYGKGLQEEGLQEAKRVAGRGCVSGVTHATRSRNPFLVVCSVLCWLSIGNQEIPRFWWQEMRGGSVPLMVMD